ncbi:hypothetical protein DIPPA_15611 [Diplonema papillatum]|nr:hypothetical protein DIPPA_15611 [Diplonema papillatum]
MLRRELLMAAIAGESDLACTKLIGAHFKDDTLRDIDEFHKIAFHSASYDRYYLVEYMYFVVRSGMPDEQEAVPQRLVLASLAPSITEAQHVLCNLPLDAAVGFALLKACVPKKDGKAADAMMERLKEAGLDRPEHYGVWISSCPDFDSVQRVMRAIWSREDELFTRRNFKRFVAACGAFATGPGDDVMREAEKAWEEAAHRGFLDDRWVWASLMAVYQAVADVAGARALDRLRRRYCEDKGWDHKVLLTVPYTNSYRLVAGAEAREA